MGKIIYLISFLRNLKITMSVAIVILLGVCGCLVFLIQEHKTDLIWFSKHIGFTTVDYNEKIESIKKELKGNIKKFKIAVVLLLLCIVGTVLIPKKEEMYMIAMVKNYEIQDIYKMSKDELKSSIDYFFEKVDELGK